MSVSTVHFELVHISKRSGARAGLLHTTHGVVETPAFVGVGTHGAIKHLSSSQAECLDLMFCNTYHLMLHPGADVVEVAGGLHRFIDRSKPILTDSGGFQVFSLAYGSVEQELKRKGAKNADSNIIKITEEGVRFDHTVMDGKFF